MSKNKRILMAVTTDVVSDMRVRKVASFLFDRGAQVTVIGRELPGSFSAELPFKVERMRMLFRRSALFYAEFTIRFFLRSIFKRFDVVVANDLDTLLPAYLLSKLKRADLVYDSHEYFTESAGLIKGGFSKKVWIAIESWIFPKLKRVSTVNDSIAEIYREKYGVDVKVVRNIPPQYEVKKTKERKDLGMPENKKVVLLQGGYIDFDRGGVELVQAMEYVDSAVLYVIGAGQEIPEMKRIAQNERLREKVVILPKMPYENLLQFTLNSDLAVSVDKPTNLNYTFSLPNKIFDYMRAEVPLLMSELPEIAKINRAFEIGLFIKNHEPKHIAAKIEEALHHERYPLWKENLKKASAHFSWENECAGLEVLYRGLI